MARSPSYETMKRWKPEFNVVAPVYRMAQENAVHQSHVCVLGQQRYNIDRLLAKGIDNNLLQKLRDRIKEKKDVFTIKRCVTLTENPPSYRAAETITFRRKYDYETLPHPPYFPDLELSDFFLFRNMKKYL